MFEQFSEEARAIIVTAQHEARQLGHKVICPEHIMLGLLQTESKVVLNIFEIIDLDVTTFEEELREFAAENSGKYGKASKSKEITLSSNTVTIIQQSLRSALKFNKRIVEAEFILTALLKDSSNALVELYMNHGLKYREVATLLIKELNNLNEETSSRQEPVAEAVSNALQGRGVTSKKSSNNSKSVLNKYGKNLTELALENKLDPIVGREKEIKRLLQVLNRRGKNNPVLVGEPGVGKTALVEGLAQALLHESTPKKLQGKVIYTLDMGLVIAGTRYRGDFEERMKEIMTEVRKRDEVILFIDEIHTIIGTGGGSEGSLDASNLMKPALARGELRTIGATTTEEYRKYFEKDSALERRFQPIQVKEPSVKETVLILEGLRERYESHHEVTITQEAILAAAELSDRYVQDRFLPDKAIDLIDEASSRVKLFASSDTVDYEQMINSFEEIKLKKVEAIEHNYFSKAFKFQKQANQLLEQLEAVAGQKDNMFTDTVDEEIIAKLVSESTGIPVSKITEAEASRMLRMERILGERVIGQKDAIKVLSKTIRRHRTGLKDPNRPIGSFIFAGPTGTGKTELSKALADFLFSSKRSLVTIDMSEYAERHNVARLFGPPPGYVGYENGGQLTEAVRQNPFSVILLDEIEKAHPAVYDPLLQVLEEGRLTDGQGRVINFKDTVIIMTTNLGVKNISNGPIGFQVDSDNVEYDLMRDKVMDALKDNMRLEFLNRIDEILVFPHLSNDSLTEIVDIFLTSVNERLNETGYSLFVSEEAKQELVRLGYDKVLGARPLRRTIQREIENPISELILFGVGATKTIEVDFKDKVFLFNNTSWVDIEEKIEASIIKADMDSLISS